MKTKIPTIRVYSDIHQEILENDESYFEIAKSGDELEQILIIAGDYDLLKRFNSPYKGNYDRFSKFNALCKRFKFVIYVLGNHEYYDGKIGGHYFLNNIKKLQTIPNLKILSRHTPSFIYDNICFIGATLWSNLSEYDDLNPRGENCSNDAKYIKQVDNGRYSSLKKNFWNKENALDFLWIQSECKKYSHMNKIIITHYPPIRILDEGDPYGIDKNYYSNDLSNKICYFQNVLTWIFGHIHLSNKFDKIIDGMHYYSNPIGYHKKTDIPEKSFLDLN